MKLTIAGLVAVIVVATGSFAQSTTQPKKQPDCKRPTYSKSVMEDQIDTVIGKQKMMLALIDESSSWMQVDSKHTDAVATFQKLRRFEGEWMENSKLLLFMVGGAPDDDFGWFDRMHEKIAELMDVNTKIFSGLTQLKSMGLDTEVTGSTGTIKRQPDETRGCVAITWIGGAYGK
jgi:hypothetical protein